MDDTTYNLYWNSGKQLYIDYGVTYPHTKTPEGISYEEYLKIVTPESKDEETK